MVLKAFLFRPATPKYPGSKLPVIDSNALRQAALQASWQRDRRVAGRRQAWRWILFWSWKYGRKGGLILGPPIAIVVVAFQFGLFQRQEPQVASLAPAKTLPAQSTIGITVKNPVLERNEVLKLQPATVLASLKPKISAVALTGSAPLNLPPTNTVNFAANLVPQPLRLKSEIQLLMKESPP